MRFRGHVVLGATLALTVVLGAAPAQALSLADAVAGSSLTSTDGSLVFSDFGAVITGDLSADFSNYELVAIDQGLRFVGPMGVADGEVGNILLTYSVEASGDVMIFGASLFSNVRAVGPGSLANVAEDLFGPGNDPLASLFVFATGSGGFDPTDSGSFTPTSSLRLVVKGIEVVSSGPGSLAAISLVQQTYVIPEPATLLLVALGSTGLLMVGRRRQGPESR